MLKRKPKILTPEQAEEIRTKDFFDMILPGTIKFLSDHYIVGDSYRCVWAIREYPPSTEEQAILSQLADRSGVTLRIYHRLVESTLIHQMETMQDRTSRNQERIRQIDKEIADLGAKNHVIARLHTSGAMNAADYAMQTSEIGNRLTELRIERRQKLTEDEDDQLLATLKDLNTILDEYEPTVEFDNGLFDEIVESITVDSSEQLTFKLIGGIALTEQIPKKGR